MKKEKKIFIIILMIWLFILDFLILKTAIDKYAAQFETIAVKNIITGAIAYYPPTPDFLFSRVILPLIIYNIIIAFLLTQSYKNFMKFRKKKNKKKGKKR